MSKQTIWNYLKKKTSLSDEAIAGIMGNFEAESNCESCRLQGDFLSSRQRSKDYANAINTGVKSVEAASVDSLGWGLAQWTFHTRKSNLFWACLGAGKGVEDEEAQLDFFLAEMQNEYVYTWKTLLKCNSIYDAASLICCDYERPAVKNIAARADYGQTIYNQFHGKDTTPEPEPEPSPSPAPVVDDRTAKIINLLEQIIVLLKEK